MIALILFALVACGADEGTNVGGVESVPYVGLTTMAVINSTNAEDIATSAYETAGTGSSATEMGDIVGLSKPRAVAMAKVLNKAVSKINAAATGTITQNGIDCGGGGTMTMTLSGTETNFYGSIVFNDYYCLDGETANGSITISARANASGEITSMNMTFNSLTIASGGETSTISGSISATISASSMTMTFTSLTMASGVEDITIGGTIAMSESVSGGTITMNMVMRDNTLDKTYKVENFTMTVAEDIYGDETITISGKFYDHDNGYVTLTTTTAILVASGAEHPSSGEVVVTGAPFTEGGTDYTSAKMIFVDPTHYQVLADTNGDGDYVDATDYDSGILTYI
jgi:hypothetical protein